MNRCPRPLLAIVSFTIGMFVLGSCWIAQSSAASPTPLTSANDGIIVECSQKEAQRQLRRTLVLEVQSLKQTDGWAFLLSQMRGTDRRPLDLTGTWLEDSARAGVASRVFCALLRYRSGHWQIIASCIGVTDVAWMDWHRKYGAPTKVFELGDAD